MGEKPLVGEYKLKLGSSIDGKGQQKSGRGTESFETLLYTFKPESVQNQTGIIWKEKDISTKTPSEKIFVEFNSSLDGDDTGSQASHKFEGMFGATGVGHHDYVLIVEGGEARLEKLSGSTRLSKLSGGTLPSTRPVALPDSLKRKQNSGGGANKSAKTNNTAPSRSPPIQPPPNDDSSDEDSSDSDSDGNSAPKSGVPSPNPPARSPTISHPQGGGGGGGGKGLLTAGGGGGGGGGGSGGKGLLTAGGGGKGLMGLQRSVTPADPSSDSDDDDSDEDSD